MTTLYHLTTEAPDGEVLRWTFISRAAVDSARAHAEACGVRTDHDDDGSEPHWPQDVANYLAGKVPDGPQWVRRGWAEVIETACGRTCVVDDDGPVLDESREAVEAEIRDLGAERARMHRASLDGTGGALDVQLIAALRDTCASDEEIVQHLAASDAAEYDAVYVGVTQEGTVVALDERTGEPLYVVERPDR
jgi:hypothetical protein